MELYQLVYLSKAARRTDKKMMTLILEKAKINNAAQDITGNLLFNSGYFMQVLEGDKEKLRALFEKIKRDLRHHEVRELYFEPAKARVFSRWSMNMTHMDEDRPTNHADLKQIVNDAKTTHGPGVITAPVRLLKAFTNN